MGGTNPAHAVALAVLRERAVTPILGERNELSGTDWLALLAKLAPFEEWRSNKTEASVEALGPSARAPDPWQRRRRKPSPASSPGTRLSRPRSRRSRTCAELLLYKRDLYLLCTNFVNFRDFYDAGEPAIFQAGTLYLDQRSCTLTLPVEDAGRHAAMAALAGSYLAYCECERKELG